MIDAGVGNPEHLDAIATAHRAGVPHVVVTHGHVDHASGVEALARRWPDTRFSKYPWADRDARYAVTWNSLSEGQTIVAGDSQLQVMHTPGHSPDHIALWHEETRTLFSGDLVVLGSTVVIPATSGGSLSQYLQSLARVIKLKPTRLLPAHGPPIDEPESILRRYIDHRLQRENQVVAALASGLRTVPDIVARIYVNLAPALVTMAQESVLAHLIKLEDDGGAARSGEEWRLY